MKVKLFLALAGASFLLWASATIVLAQEEPPSPYAGLKNPFPWDNASAQAAGKELYQQYCLFCHGTKGGNLVGPDFRTTNYRQRLQERPDFYFWILSEGRLNKGMPPYKTYLSEEQRWQVLTYLSSLSTTTALPEAPPPPETPPTKLNCLNCHQITLQAHNKLGSGSEACWSCHYSSSMTTLHLAGGTQLPLSEFPRLCAQCHQKRYEAWERGTHGVAAWKEGDFEIRSTEKVACTACHDPHQPRVVLLGITKLHPEPTPPPPSPPLDPLIIFGTSLLIIIVIGVTQLGKRGS